MNKSSLSVINNTLWMKSRVLLQIVAVAVMLLIAAGTSGCVVSPHGGTIAYLPNGQLVALSPAEQAAQLNRAVSSTSSCGPGTVSVQVQNDVGITGDTQHVDQTVAGFPVDQTGRSNRNNRRINNGNGLRRQRGNSWGGPSTTQVVTGSAIHTERCILDPKAQRQAPMVSQNPEAENAGVATPKAQSTPTPQGVWVPASGNGLTTTPAPN